ncbi:MAG: nicotinate phosphoribosyltransferase, partial [Anaerolineae bacterium]|nr:nicotinate phosphoribosyltransferase [Anaerolineae bacterium]
MSLFSGRRLTQTQLQQDIDGLRQGIYSDKYFANVVQILQGLIAEGYRFSGTAPRSLPVDLTEIDVGNIIVEAQIFNRRAPQVLVGGVDAALSMLRHATGYFKGDQFIETWENLEIRAVQDGDLTHYDGDPTQAQPVIKIHGHYRDFALLETPLLGVLTHISRIATNVYELLQAANGKPVLFFPARFDLPQTQASDGYAYWLAVQRYNQDAGKILTPSISTDAQGLWWNGRGGGTVPHALIASFLGDSAEAMVAFARHIPITTPRILLADFDNDTITATRQTLNAYWQHYRAALLTGDETEQKRWTLNGVRLDTAGNLVDAGLPADAEPGVSPALVKAVREAIDTA